MKLQLFLAAAGGPVEKLTCWKKRTNLIRETPRLLLEKLVWKDLLWSKRNLSRNWRIRLRRDSESDSECDLLKGQCHDLRPHHPRWPFYSAVTSFHLHGPRKTSLQHLMRDFLLPVRIKVFFGGVDLNLTLTVNDGHIHTFNDGHIRSFNDGHFRHSQLVS